MLAGAMGWVRVAQASHHQGSQIWVAQASSRHRRGGPHLGPKARQAGVLEDGSDVAARREGGVEEAAVCEREKRGAKILVVPRSPPHEASQSQHCALPAGGRAGRRWIERYADDTTPRPPPLRHPPLHGPERTSQCHRCSWWPGTRLRRSHRRRPSRPPRGRKSQRLRGAPGRVPPRVRLAGPFASLSNAPPPPNPLPRPLTAAVTRRPTS